MSVKIIVDRNGAQLKAVGFDQPISCAHTSPIACSLSMDNSGMMFVAIRVAIIGPIGVQFDDVAIGIADEYR